MKYIFLTEKNWHRPTFEQLLLLVKANWRLIDTAEDFAAKVKEFDPDRVFVPHWSKMIPAEIYNRYECIVFHMTDLPYGRGGSPLQNLIERGETETQVSAIRVSEVLDGGDIYLKKNLSLWGTAQEIFMRCSDCIRDMIVEIDAKNIVPSPQTGTVVDFKRRTPDQSDVSNIKGQNKMYDMIRMVDCDGYPNAFIETEHFRFEFSRASVKDYKTILADVRIISK